mgnify:CR=1 FL=1
MKGIVEQTHLCWHCEYCMVDSVVLIIICCWCYYRELPDFLGGTCSCANKGGCLRSDRGPWNDPFIMQVLFWTLLTGFVFLINSSCFP